jgi:hypothetical protein
MSNVVTHPRAIHDPHETLRRVANDADVKAVAVVVIGADGGFRCTWSGMRKSQLLAMAAWLQFDAMHETMKDQDG